MPGFDRTGPMGRGPRTGWGRGWCYPAYPAQGTEVKTSGQEPTATPVAGEQQGAYQPSIRPVYGLGQGGIPWGCGRGFRGGCFRGRWRY